MGLGAGYKDRINFPSSVPGKRGPKNQLSGTVEGRHDEKEYLGQWGWGGSGGGGREKQAHSEVFLQQRVRKAKNLLPLRWGRDLHPNLSDSSVCQLPLSPAISSFL